MRRSKALKQTSFNSPLKSAKVETKSSEGNRVHETQVSVSDSEEQEKTKLIGEIQDLQLKVEQYKKEGYTEENYRKYLNLMHDYNDMKDLASAYMGHLATLKQCTVRELYKQYGLDPEND